MKYLVNEIYLHIKAFANRVFMNASCINKILHRTCRENIQNIVLYVFQCLCFDVILYVSKIFFCSTLCYFYIQNFLYKKVIRYVIFVFIYKKIFKKYC